MGLVKGSKYEGFVKGYDLTGDEELCNTLEFHYKNLLQLKNKYGINYYFHAGEIMNSDKSLININMAIKLESIRIGHGIYAFNNDILSAIKSNDITLEICPISNKLLYNYKLDINDIIENINNIVIGSDDDNKLGTNLSYNYLYLYKKGLSLDNIYVLLKNNIQFIPNYTYEEFDVEFNEWKQNHNIL
jgi:adenosine deaminase